MGERVGIEEYCCMDNQVKENLGYHYTSVEVLMALLDNLNNDTFLFHASSVFSLNDPTEMKFGYEKIIELLPQFEKELSIEEEKYKLSNFWNNDTLYTPDHWHQLHLDMMENSFQHPFILSYSQNRDTLPMWNMYGKNGAGIALGLDLRMYFYKQLSGDGKKIYDITHLDMNQPHSVDVEYGKVPCLTFPFLMAKTCYVKYWEGIQNKTENHKLAETQLNVITNMMKVAAPFVKHKAYEFEKESRLIQFHNNINDIKTKINSIGKIIPYIEVELPKAYLKEIIIGPCCDFNTVKKCIELKMLQKGIELKDFEITPSSVPYRNN